MKNVDYSEFYLANLVSKIKALDLKCPKSLLTCKLKKLQEVYNGCGPEWLGRFGRKVLTGELKLFEPAILIHDYRFHLSDGTEEGFNAANKEFFENCKKIVSDSFGIFSIDYWRWYMRARLAYRACCLGGWSAYKEANEKYVKL